KNLLTQEQIAYLLALQIEPPIALGKTLITLELLDSAHTAALVKQYLSEFKNCPAPIEEKRNEFANS
ncbi:MAG: hypothetical protein ABIK07_19235, partial [Planctomycetota bacterium]